MPRARRVRRIFPITLSGQEVCTALGISIEKLNEARLANKIECYKHGTKRFYLVADVVDFVKREFQRI